MTKILIEDIEKEPNKTLFYEFNEFMEEFGAEIFADLELKSLGQFIEVSGTAQGKLKLICDRCLQEFEIKDGQFVTDLNGEKEIDIYDLLYQSVILNLPNKKVCGINCKGREFLTEEEIIDPRLEVFNNIQINPKK